MRFVLCLAVTKLALAQLSGPVLGLVPDGDRVRAMQGMPAAGAVGPVIASGLAHIAISPAQNYAIALQDGTAVLVSRSGSITPITGAASNFTSASISPTGSAAALWFAASSHFEIITGLPASPAVRELDATAFGPPIAFAVSDDGHVAASFAAGVETFGLDGAVSPINVNDRVLALTFFTQSTDLALATPTAVWSVTAGTASSVYTAPAQRLHGTPRLENPGAIALSSEKRWIVASLRAGIVAIDLTTGSASSVDCECKIDGVFPLVGPIFRLTNTGSNGGVKLIDASKSAPLDVPPARSEQ
jgi:hypothetical protein